VRVNASRQHGTVRGKQEVKSGERDRVVVHNDEPRSGGCSARRCAVGNKGAITRAAQHAQGRVVFSRHPGAGDPSWCL